MTKLHNRVVRLETAMPTKTGPDVIVLMGVCPHIRVLTRQAIWHRGGTVFREVKDHG